MDINKIKGRFAKWVRAIPSKKHYFEFISALLTIPVLVTVILINLNNLNQKKSGDVNKTAQTVPAVTPEKNTTPVPINIHITQDSTRSADTNTPTPASCKNQLGPVDIASPQEGQIVTGDRVCLELSYDTQSCPITWAYRFDSGAWSDYTDKQICLYNLSPGQKHLEVKFNSVTSGEETVVQRDFIYQTAAAVPSSAPSPTPQSASQSAIVQ